MCVCVGQLVYMIMLRCVPSLFVVEKTMKHTVYSTVRESLVNVFYRVGCVLIRQTELAKLVRQVSLLAWSR